MSVAEPTTQPVFRCERCGYWLPRIKGQRAPDCPYCAWEKTINHRGTTYGRPIRAPMYEAVRAEPIFNRKEFVE